jgi:hypothetical protein
MHLERPVWRGRRCRRRTRQTGDNEAAQVNVQVEYFIAASGGEIVHTLDNALAVLARLLHS